VDNLSRAKWIGAQEFKTRWGVDLSTPYVLITVHPETVGFEKNQAHLEELICALEQIDEYDFVVTMPNADTQGAIIRNLWHQFASRNARVHLVENFGTEGYMTAMRHCAFMMGNTSSGFVEAEFFPKPVINLGERQRGRILTRNIVNCQFNTDQILASVSKISSMGPLARTGIYGDGNAASTIAEAIRSYLGIPLRA
jgi:GDP/UDP-N,N'-diacetylbacillosamine 2-epimerase (hydrolysing)